VDLGIDADNLRRFDVPDSERAHYSAATIDLEYRFGFTGSEWGELMGIANRTDFDLSSHTDASGTKMQYFDQAANERYTPYVIEPSFGLTRSMMAFLVDAYSEDEAPNAKGGVDKRTVLKLDPRLAPVKAAVLPLSKSEDLVPRAEELAARLRRHWNVDMDVTQAIGRRYRRQDEIGTPFCLTVDFETAEDQSVTIRERDTMAQERVALDQVESYLAARLIGVCAAARRPGRRREGPVPDRRPCRPAARMAECAHDRRGRPRRTALPRLLGAARASAAGAAPAGPRGRRRATGLRLRCARLRRSPVPGPRLGAAADAAGRARPGGGGRCHARTGAARELGGAAHALRDHLGARRAPAGGGGLGCGLRRLPHRGRRLPPHRPRGARAGGLALADRSGGARGDRRPRLPRRPGGARQPPGAPVLVSAGRVAV